MEDIQKSSTLRNAPDPEDLHSGCKSYSQGVLIREIEVNLMTVSHRASEMPVSFL